MLRRCHFRFPISPFPVANFTAPRINSLSSFLILGNSAKIHSSVRFCSLPVKSASSSWPQDEEKGQVSSSASSPSLSLLQTFTQPGKIRPHPLRLLADFAETELRASLFQHQNHKIIKPEQGIDESSTISSSSLPIEEIQIVTADAARRVAQTLRNIAAGDDDQDTGVSKSSSSSTTTSAIDDPLSFDSETLMSSIIDKQSSAVGAALLAEEQRRFEEVHARIFGSGLIEEWVDAWEKDFIISNNKNNHQENKVPREIAQNQEKKSIVFDEEALLMNSMNAENNNDFDIHNAPSPSDEIIAKTTENNGSSDQNNNNNNNQRHVILNTSSPSATFLDKQLPSIVTLLQRHILIASLVSRFDAAVQAFMLLAQIRQHVNIIIDHGYKNKNGAAAVNVEVLSWRNLRDVVSSCAKQGQYETAETLVRFVLKKVIDAGNQNNNNSNSLVWPGISPENLQESLEKMVPSHTMTALAKCIKSAKDLQRFRELMAVEGQNNKVENAVNAIGGGGNDNEDDSKVLVAVVAGSLSHIPVSTELYTELISACSRATDEPRRADFALMFHRAITDNGLDSTPATFAALIGVFASRGSPTEAFGMFHEAKSKCSSAEIASCPALYNRLIDSYCQAGKLHDCIATTNILLENGAPITRRGFHAAMMSCAVQGDYGQCQSFLRIMQGNAKNVRTTIGVGERIGLLNHGSSSGNNHNGDLYYSATNPSLFYSIPPTPTSLAIQLASLFFIRKSKEFSWREKLTILGDLTNDAFSLLPLKEGEQENDEKNDNESSGSKSFQRISLFCENEPFFCAILGKVLSESIICPSLFDSFSPPQSAKNKQIMKTNTENDDVNINNSLSSSSTTINNTLQEKYLYKKHVNLPVRILQAHAQQVLVSLLERAFERHEATIDQQRNISTNNDDEKEQQQKEYEFLENIISRASSLFAPQRPTRMPINASVAALLPDVILNPSASIFTDGDDGESSSLFSSNARSSVSSSSSSSASFATESGQTLLHLLQTILPTTTFFLLPFASIQAIVAEFDALSVMNDYPLMQRELFESQLRRATSQLVANADERNKISAFEAKMSKALFSKNRNGNKYHNSISSSDVAKLISTSNNREQQFQRSSTSAIGGSAKNNSSSSTLEEVQDEKCSLSFHEKEYRLDKLSDAVLALAVFLHHHGDRVHIGSAMEDLDLSRCSSALRMKNTDAIQRAAANSIGSVFSALDVGTSWNENKNEQNNNNNDADEFGYRTAFYQPDSESQPNSNNNMNSKKEIKNQARKNVPSFTSFGGDMFIAVEKSLQHDRMAGNRSRNSTMKIPRISRPLLNLMETYDKKSNSPSSQSTTLYFDSRVNLNLVTCDIGLRRKLVNKNFLSSKFNNTAIPTTSTIIRTMQKLAQDFDKITDTKQQNINKNNNNNEAKNTLTESRGLRNITGLGRAFSFQKKQNKFVEDKSKNHEQQQQKPRHDPPASFGVRLIDPTKAIM